ncbi:LEC14B protein-like isoform X2 [Magnolia sinica]|uniref:LEC14B protein-like isoform X2 n=1 Tax=Magnolia sinica TaxID=86752 RepID=UPI00265A6E14|nr:LEC14B protein-like isoform X2 [Magnolia sinica]
MGCFGGPCTLWSFCKSSAYSTSRQEVDSNMHDRGKSTVGSCIRQRHHGLFPLLDHEVCHLTKSRSAPSEMIRKVTPSKHNNMPISTVKMLSAREANFSGKGRFSLADRCHVLSRYLPVNARCRIDRMDTRAYVSQFSADGTLFFAGFQGSHIRIYNVDNVWKVQKDILAKSLRWTITDTSLSPDQRYLVYASMSPVVHIVNVGSAVAESHANITEIHDGLNFSDDDGDGDFGIFSVKFSTDGRELVAGTGDHAIYVYDLEANKPSLQISAHLCDVNTVAFADETGHLIYSGSDDNLCKVWDRRCLNDSRRAAGVLTGHLEGITFLDSRGDGRYFISNGKDQTTKLWDIRRMSCNEYMSVKQRTSNWDYQWMDYPASERHRKHPSDQSLATYRGHSVLRTLIRCYFSPEYSTGQKYIYTGSNNGNIYIYDVVTGAQVAKLDYHDLTVRDCSWHPTYPMLVSSSWDGMIVQWEFLGNGKASAMVRKKKRRRLGY